VNSEDVVLIHAAGSGVGVAAIQLAVSMGATVIAVAGTDAKLETARSLGAKHTINYKTTNFGEAVKAAVPTGATVILDCVGASFFAMNADCASAGAKWVVYGTLGGDTPDAPVLRLILQKRLRIEGTTLRARPLAYKADLARQFVEYAALKFASGDLKPIIAAVYPLAQVADAHAFMESDENNGKILLKVID